MTPSRAAQEEPTSPPVNPNIGRKAEGECLVTDWRFDPRGYGYATVGGIHWRSNRYAWSLVNGPIPMGMVICHACDNPSCINPDHLWLGTPSDNTRDRDAKGRAATGDRNGSRTHPESRPRGAHPYRVRNIGVRNGHAKLTPDQVREIRLRVEAGEQKKALAIELGVDEMTIGRIVRRERWASVL